MDKYGRLEVVGRGSFGEVWKAFDKQTLEVVAVKKLIQKFDKNNKHLLLREIMALKQLNNHPNIVKLKEVIVEDNTMFMVFEYMEGSLYKRIMERSFMKQSFSEDEIRDLCFQLFEGLAHMHRNGYFHRDLKPDNLLVSKDVIKIGDLGSSRNKRDTRFPLTDYITTRWYRAPEVLLGSTCYDEYVDMWAMGAIMAELFMLEPLFKGSSTQEMIHQISYVVGSPTKCTWREGVRRASEMNIQFPKFIGVEFCKLFPNASPCAVNLISSLLSWDPWTRPSALEALQHPFFNNVSRVRWYNPGAAIKTGNMVFRLAMGRELLKKRGMMHDWI